jgi:hypothetical protein
MPFYNLLIHLLIPLHPYHRVHSPAFLSPFPQILCYLLTTPHHLFFPAPAPRRPRLVSRPMRY